MHRRLKLPLLLLWSAIWIEVFDFTISTRSDIRLLSALIITFTLFGALALLSYVLHRTFPRSLS